MATLAEVRDTAAGMLGRRTPGQAIPNALVLELNKSYDRTYAKLKAKRLNTWGKANNSTIPDEVADQVAALMAFSATAVFGVSPDRMTRIREKNSTAISEIMDVVNPKYDSLDHAEDF
jgi:hypothetical protein